MIEGDGGSRDADLIGERERVTWAGVSIYSIIFILYLSLIYIYILGHMYKISRSRSKYGLIKQVWFVSNAWGRNDSR